MRRDVAEKWVFGLEMVVFGVPALGVATPLLLVGMMISLAGLVSEPIAALPFVALVGGGIAGLLGWFVLGLTYLTGDVHELRDMHWGWWAALAVGVLACAPFLLMQIEQPGSNLWLLLCGPPLLVPALHLALLRWRYRYRVRADGIHS